MGMRKLAGKEAGDKGQWPLQCGMSINHTSPRHECILNVLAT